MPMEWLKILGTIFGSAAGVALINLWSNRLNRKDQVADRKDDTITQIEDLREETTKQFAKVDTRFANMDERFDKLSEDMEGVKLSTRATAYDRIRHLGMQYVKAGEISFDDLRAFTEMHDGYKATGGNGFFDTLMNTINNLPPTKSYDNDDMPD